MKTQLEVVMLKGCTNSHFLSIRMEAELSLGSEHVKWKYNLLISTLLISRIISVPPPLHLTSFVQSLPLPLSVRVHMAV